MPSRSSRNSLYPTASYTGAAGHSPSDARDGYTCLLLPIILLLCRLNRREAATLAVDLAVPSLRTTLVRSDLEAPEVASVGSILVTATVCAGCSTVLSDGSSGEMRLDADCCCCRALNTATKSMPRKTMTLVDSAMLCATICSGLRRLVTVHMYGGFFVNGSQI